MLAAESTGAAAEDPPLFQEGISNPEGRSYTSAFMENKVVRNPVSSDIPWVDIQLSCYFKFFFSSTDQYQTLKEIKTEEVKGRKEIKHTVMVCVAYLALEHSEIKDERLGPEAKGGGSFYHVKGAKWIKRPLRNDIFIVQISHFLFYLLEN